jgi:hypothetical protein
MSSLATVTFLLTAAIVAAYAMQLWTRHARRQMVHTERMAALEKGIDLPPLVEQEIKRGSWNVQRLLLLAGLVWISVGLTLSLTLIGLSNESPLRWPWGTDFNTGQPIFIHLGIRRGFVWIGLAPILIGLSHLIVYQVGKNKEREEAPPV